MDSAYIKSGLGEPENLPPQGGGGDTGQIEAEQIEGNNNGAEPEGGLAPFGSKIGQLAERLQELKKARELADEEGRAQVKKTLEVVYPAESVETPAEKLRYLSRFFGLRTADVYTAEQFEEMVVITPEVEAKIERLFKIAKTIEHKAELREQVRVLGKVFDTTVEATRDIIDHTSNWTEDHSTRLTLWAYQIVEDIGGFSTEYKKGVLQAGLLHDAGKIAVPKTILDKNGRPTDEEFKRIRKHTEDGYDLLVGLRRHRPYIVDGVHHHEKVDGTGYGRNLKGAEIPFMSRVLAVADVGDATLDFRPYKNGWTLERVASTMQKDAGTHFDKVPVAYFIDDYESRRFSIGEYFDPAPREDEINMELRALDPFSVDRNIASKQSDIGALSGVALEGLGQGQKLVDPEDLLELVGGADETKLSIIEGSLNGETEKLSSEVDKMHEVSVDALFLLIKSVDARYRIYESAEGKSVLGGQQRTENIIRYSLMLAQQMGLSVEEQKKVAMAAMFCDIGVLGVDPEKIGMKGILGITDFDEIKKMPKIGAEILKRFVEDPELGQYFVGAEVGAAEANLSADGKSGYGTPLGKDRQVSDIGKIIQIGYKYTALRTPNHYRGDGFTHAEAMRIMRPLVGTEFGEKEWLAMEQLGALDVVRVFKDRPEVVGVVKSVLSNHESPLYRDSAELTLLKERVTKILSAESSEEKIKLCFEAAKSASLANKPDNMERMLELAEELVVESTDPKYLTELKKLYTYDLEQSKLNAFSEVEVRLKEAKNGGGVTRVHNALGVISSLITDYAEMGQVLDNEAVERFKSMVVPVYLESAEKLLKEYVEDIYNGDYDAANAKSKTLEIAINDIGSDEFRGRVAEVKEQAAKGREKVELAEYIQQIQDAPDPWNGEHYVTVAHKLLDKLSEPDEELAEKLARVERKFYRRSYTAMFGEAQATAEAGRVQVTQELLSKVREWMGLAGRDNAISEAQFESVMEIAYRNGVVRMERLLQLNDLGLEDVPRVSRWVRNINEWQAKLAGEMVGDVSEELQLKQRRALSVIRENLPREVRELLDGGNMIDTKRFLVTFDEYVVKSPAGEVILGSELDALLGEVKAKLMVQFSEDMGHRVKRGDEKGVKDAIQHFKGFCIEPAKKDRDGNHIDEIVRMEINGKENGMFHDLMIAVKERALRLRVQSIESAVPNVSVVSGATPEQRVDKELRAWNDIAGRLVEEGGMVDETLHMQLTDATYGLVAGRIAWAIKEGKAETLAGVLDHLKGWLAESLIDAEEEKIGSLQTILKPSLEGMFANLTNKGEWESMRHLAESVMSWWGESMLPENYEVMASDCRRKYLAKMQMQMEIHGIKSELVEMRGVEKRVLAELSEIGSLDEGTEDTVASYAEKALHAYQYALLSKKSFGNLMSRAVRRAIAEDKRMQVELMDIETPGAMGDGRSMGQFLEGV